MLFVDMNSINPHPEVQSEAVFGLFYAVLSGVFFLTRFYLVVTNVNLSLITPVSKTSYGADAFIHCFTKLLFSLDLT